MTERCGVEPVLTLKFVALYALEIFVIAMVGAVVIAGLYQLARNQVRATLSRTEDSHAHDVALIREGWRTPAAMGIVQSPAGRPREDGWSRR